MLKNWSKLPGKLFENITPTKYLQLAFQRYNLEATAGQLQQDKKSKKVFLKFQAFILKYEEEGYYRQSYKI